MGGRVGRVSGCHSHGPVKAERARVGTRYNPPSVSHVIYDRESTAVHIRAPFCTKDCGMHTMSLHVVRLK